jgi:hypothetical protein
MSVLDTPFRTLKEARAVIHSFSSVGKMPCPSYGISAYECNVGGRLRGKQGSICADCYALKNQYVFPNVTAAHAARLEAIRHPRWADAMVMLIDNWCTKHDEPHFRWHDSGDLQDEEHLDKICEIADRLPYILFWLPTRERKIVRDYPEDIPPNLIIRFSMPMQDMSPPQAGLDEGILYSMVNRNTPVPDGVYSCPSRYQDGACGDCRTCWDADTQVISYHYH